MILGHKNVEIENRSQKEFFEMITFGTAVGYLCSFTAMENIAGRLKGELFMLDYRGTRIIQWIKITLHSSKRFHFLYSLLPKVR